MILASSDGFSPNIVFTYVAAVVLGIAWAAGLIGDVIMTSH